MEAKSPAYVWGMIVGFAVAFLIVVVCKRLFVKKNEKREYDERQKLAIAKGYKFGYFTLVGYCMLAGLVDVITGVVWCSLYTNALIGILLSVGVFGVICIRNDAYLPLRQSPKRYILMFVVLGGINLAIGIAQLLHTGSFVTDGMLTNNVVNPLVGVLLLILAAALGFKTLRENRAREAE